MKQAAPTKAGKKNKSHTPRKRSVIPEDWWGDKLVSPQKVVAKTGLQRAYIMATTEKLGKPRKLVCEFTKAKDSDYLRHAAEIHQRILNCNLCKHECIRLRDAVYEGKAF